MGMIGCPEELIQLHVDRPGEPQKVARRVRRVLGANADAVHCCSWFNHPTRAEVDRLFDLLSKDERDRALAFRFDCDRRRYVGCRGWLREFLGAYLECDPQLLGFRYSERGKPHVADEATGLCFNISHSADLACIIIGRGGKVGVDVEEIRPFESLIEVARFFLPADEVERLKHSSEDNATQRFFQLWTSKEALLKATGEGLVDDLPNVPGFPVNGRRSRLNFTLPSAGERCTLFRLTGLPSGFAGTAAIIFPASDFK